jgi:hypothetical protein
MANPGLSEKTKRERFKIARQCAADGLSLIGAARACGLTSGGTLRQNIEKMVGAQDILAQLVENGRALRRAKGTAALLDAQARGCEPWHGVRASAPPSGPCRVPVKAGQVINFRPPDADGCETVGGVRKPIFAAARAYLPPGFGGSFQGKGGQGNA